MQKMGRKENNWIHAEDGEKGKEEKCIPTKNWEKLINADDGFKSNMVSNTLCFTANMVAKAIWFLSQYGF